MFGAVTNVSDPEFRIFCTEYGRKPLNLVPAFDGVQFVRGIGCIRALILLEISRCSSDNETKTEEALLFRIAEFHLLINAYDFGSKLEFH